MTKALAERGIVWVMALLFAARGLVAIITQNYQSTSKLGPPVSHTGAVAVSFGLAWLAMGLVWLSFELKRKWPSKPVLFWSWGIVWTAVALAAWVWPYL